MAERVSDARSYNLFPSYPVVYSEKETDRKEKKRKKKRPKKQMDPSPS